MKSSTRFQLPRGCGWLCLTLGVLLALLGILSALAIQKLWSRSEEVWVETPGTVTSSYLEGGSRETYYERARMRKLVPASTSSNTFHPCLKYRYRVGDGDFTGDAWALRQPENDEDRAQAQAIADSYREGDALPVFHDPADPGKSRLTPKEPRLEFGKDVIFILLYLGSGALLMWVARVILRPRPQEAP